MEEAKEIELDEINIIVKIPKDTARITIHAVVLDDDGSPLGVSKTLNPEDIRQARQDFLDNVEDGDDYDALFVLTDAGREWLEQQEKNR